jgi:DNA processing protein
MDTSDTTTALALLASRGVGERALSRWLSWAVTQGRPLRDWAGRPREELVRAFPQQSESVVVALASMDDDVLMRAGRWVDRVHAAGGQFVFVTQPDYPAALRRSLGVASPPVLSVLGDPGFFEREATGVVGTRTPSEAGAEVARLSAQWAVSRERVVVSGGAQGTDLAAHAAAIESGGSTIVVLPQGLLTFPVSTSVAAAVDQGTATLVSQFLPDAGWTTGGAVTRNATIAALSRMVCVIEPHSPGGSMKTGRDALAQHKAVLVYAGVGSRGGELIRAGARPLLGPAGRFTETYLDEAWSKSASDWTEQIELL